ncbi:hypothetical protein K1T71_006414 [Dendrolimus kikuchii]|uniref:Uncharacterized protein n=1 Tax=Dendrolimus kikuchii TaxID=765133 RepID=A0ACC1D0S0_9NEOP|nr:hypothetical protein K1T71_006414 [Dendrolimus kikuchii]
MSFCPKRWVVAIYLFVQIPRANFQIPVPLFPMMPASIPLAQPAIPIVIRIPNFQDLTSTTTTTTTSTERTTGQGVLVPLPMPMPFHMPYPLPVQIAPVKPPNKAVTEPPCPPCVCQPSCTPAFYSYCSPCHKKCRCQSSNKPIQSNGYAVPVPMVQAIPAPIVMVPYPPQIYKSNEGDESSSSSCSEEYRRSYRRPNNRRNKRKRLLKKRKHRFTRRNLKSMDSDSDGNFVRPVLTYVSENGNIKIKRRLSDNDAVDLLNDNDSSQENNVYETVQVATDYEIAKDDDKDLNSRELNVLETLMNDPKLLKLNDIENVLNFKKSINHKENNLRNSTDDTIRLNEENLISKLSSSSQIGNMKGSKSLQSYQDLKLQAAPKRDVFPSIADINKLFNSVNRVTPVSSKELPPIPEDIFISQPAPNKINKPIASKLKPTPKVIKQKKQPSNNLRRTNKVPKAKVPKITGSQIKNSQAVVNSNQCCNTVICYPCPMPVTFVQPPIIVPARAYFEPVIHDHPPLDVMRKIMKKQKSKHRYTDYSYDDSSGSCTDTGSDTDTSADYYGDFMHVTG